jgi:hypothetical protein
MSDEKEPKTLLMDGFDKAFIGGLRKFGQSLPIAVYDFDKVMDILMERDGLDEDDAAEHIEFNMLGGWHGEGTPCMLFRCTLREFVDECGGDLAERRDGDDVPAVFPDEEDMTSEEQRLYRQAINDFCLNFIRYVKETDKVMYGRAKDYAKDYSGNALIEFVDVDDDDEDGKDGKP